MQILKKALSVILVLCLCLSLLPATVFASGTNSVYISVSYDGQYIDDKNGDPIAYIPVSFDNLASIDLDTYGLGEYKYDEDGDGTYDITALHMVIYAHENIYGGNWDEVRFSGAPGSSYFEGGIFGFDENLNYYLNGEYPLAGEGWGATSDQIVLEAGDFLDIGSFSSWDFYMDSNYGFHFFADQNGTFTHNYTAEAGTAVPVKLVRSFSGMGVDATVYDTADYTISYGSAYGNATGTVTTDASGCVEIIFPSAGTWILWADGGYGCEFPDAVVSSPAYAKVTVTAAEEPEPVVPDQPRQAQSVTTQLNATMAKMAATVTEPAFGTTAGEWTVLSLARGGYFAKDNAYFTDYYNRIVQTVNETAASVNMNGALHKNKSTENARLIVALSAIGKDATSVGNWNLVEAYSANGFNWIKKQGLNGTIWALIALDSNDYETTDTTIRQQCIDAIVAAQHDDGGWSLMANKTYASDPDITGMALTALYPYRDQTAVAEVCAEAIACLSAIQHDNGTYESGGSECSESCAWAIIACTTWGINPDTDNRFIKNGNSAVDGLLAHYVESESMFQHIIGAGTNAMGTDQGCYGLVAYDRFIHNKSALYDFSDVTFDPSAPGTGNEETDPAQMNATLALPAQIENTAGTEFNAIISIDKWDNEAGYKLIDFLMTIPDGLSVTGVTAGERLAGGNVSYNLNAESGTDEEGNQITTNNLRCVYFDANENKTLTITGDEFPAEVFTISFKLDAPITAGSLKIAIGGMSVKLSSDSSDEDSMIIVNTDPVTDPEGGTTGGGSGDVGVVTGVSFSAVELYKGDDVDLIPTTRKAVAVAVTGIDRFSTLVYNDGTNNIQFQYSDQITSKSNIPTFVALVDSEIAMSSFINKDYFTVNGNGVDQSNIAFGDTNSDNIVNAQDALAVVDAWLRKGDAPTDSMILRMNVNGDSRINTFDALGIVEAFVNSSTYGVVTKAATLASVQ